MLRTEINPTPSDFKEIALNHVLVAQQCKVNESIICYEGVGSWEGLQERDTLFKQKVREANWYNLNSDALHRLRPSPELPKMNRPLAIPGHVQGENAPTPTSPRSSRAGPPRPGLSPRSERRPATPARTRGWARTSGAGDEASPVGSRRLGRSEDAPRLMPTRARGAHGPTPEPGCGAGSGWRVSRATGKHAGDSETGRRRRPGDPAAFRPSTRAPGVDPNPPEGVSWPPGPHRARPRLG